MSTENLLCYDDEKMILQQADLASTQELSVDKSMLPLLIFKKQVQALGNSRHKENIFT